MHFSSLVADLCFQCLFYRLVPFVFQDAQDDAVSSAAVGLVHIAAQNAINFTSNAFNRLDASLIFKVGSKFHTLHVQHLEGEFQQQELAIFVQTTFLKGLSIPFKAPLQCSVLQLNVVEPCAARKSFFADYFQSAFFKFSQDFMVFSSSEFWVRFAQFVFF